MPRSSRFTHLPPMLGQAGFHTSVLLMIALYLSAPDGVGAVALFATAVSGLIAAILGVLVHRPAVRRPWYWLSGGGVLFIVSLLLRFELLALPHPIGFADIWSFAGYACIAMFLRGLLRRTRSGSDTVLWLDTAAITVGSGLVGWVMNIAPNLNNPDHPLGATVVNTLYPVMDAVLLALTVQLAFRRGSGSVALRAAVVGLAALLLGDLAYTFIWAQTPGAVNPYVNTLYMVAYAYIGLMAAHPAMRELSDHDVAYEPTVSRARLAITFLAMVTPASIPIMLPTHGVVDGAVRAAVMTVFGGLVFLRLLVTIQALREAQAEAQRRATHDHLTGLPNRSALMEDLAGHLTEVQAGSQIGWVNVLLIDCDHFKQINDTWGHIAGDELLVRFADRLRSTMRPGDHLSRVGGDEFVLRIDTQEPEQITAVAERIVELTQEPLPISSGQLTRLPVSIGIAQSPYSTSVSADDLVRNADIALYEAKGGGRGTHRVYDSSMHACIARRREIADALRTAASGNEISVMFQPIRAGEDYSELVGWEALARWNHPTLGPVRPDEFIPIAEDTGQIVEIGAFVLQEACQQLHAWQQRYRLPGLHVAVNVSSVQLLREGFVDLVGAVLESAGLTAESLWLEITESVVLERTDEVLSVLGALNELGVRLCMDDFGTGYSSLAYLKDFTVSILKVDKSFIDDLVSDERDQKLTKAMVDVAAALDLDGVVAEGVETAEQARVLGQLGCTLVQGYYFGRPQLPQEATASADQLLLSPSAGPVPHPRRPDTTDTSSVRRTNHL